MSDTLQRRTTPSGRVYTNMEDLFLPSVTTVLNTKKEPEGLKYWRKKYNGKNGNKHWKDILSYKANRGTMIHYNLLNEFAPEDIYSRNEEDSTDELKLNGNWDRYEDENIYAESAWQEIKEIRGITQENVLDVECFVTNEGIGYAGQFDLLYIDTDGNLVLSDLKTSKRVYDKHQLQLVAYENALSLDIDRLEVIRIHPDSESWEISHDSDWSKNRNELWGEFVTLRTSMGDVEEEFRQIAQEGIDDE